MKKDELIGWHFSTGKLGYGDGREIIIGKTHKVKGPLELCACGLHASERIIDALQYAHGPMVYKVRLHGKILRGDDKACATQRTYLAGFDATDILRLFARKCALDVIHLWDAPDVVKRYLETGDESLRAAAWAAAGAAAWAAARAAAGAAAGAVAWDAARAALLAAAWDAARAAAWAAAWDAQNTRLLEMVEAKL